MRLPNANTAGATEGPQKTVPQIEG